MKKVLLFISGIALMGTCLTSWLGCAHMSPKSESTAMKSKEAGRKFAGDLDAGIVGPNGEVILFYKSGGEIVIQKCEDNTVLDQRSDCTIKAGTHVTRVPVHEFKRRLKAALNVPGDYTSDMKAKIEVYKKQTTIDPVELDKAIKRIQDFIRRYGAENAEPGIMDKLNAMKGASEINGLVDRLVDRIIDKSILKQYVFSKDKTTFEFNILRAFVDKIPDFTADFVTIKAGSFDMGSPWSEANRNYDENMHNVTITKDFSIQTTVVTQGQYFLAMGYNPSTFATQDSCNSDQVWINNEMLCPNNPVENVSWQDAQDFIAKLNASDSNYSYRLPTEAEWEYSARGGTQTVYWYGNDADKLGDYVWYADNSGGTTHAVGTKPANQYGLYDAHGNVWQWVQDWYYARSYPPSEIDPLGPVSGSDRVLRGGSVCTYCSIDKEVASVRAARRSFASPDYRSNYVGFRLVRTAKESKNNDVANSECGTDEILRGKKKKSGTTNAGHAFSIDDRIRDCAQLGESSTKKPSYSGVTWNLVSRIRSTERGKFKEVWKDSKSGLIWGDKLDGNYGYIGEYEFQNPRCASKEGIDANAGISEKSFGIPTINEFLEADHDGIIFVVPNMKGEIYWSSSKAKSDETEIWAFEGNMGGKSRQTPMYNNFNSIRCVGR